MALGEESNGGIPATMLVGPASVGNAGMPYPVYYPQGGGNGGNGGWDNGNGWWIILLFILLASGNWGNNGFGGNGGGYGAPIVVNDGNNGSVQRGFDQAAVMGGIGDVQASINGIGTQLCNGFAGVNATINATAANAETAANARAMANMQQLFGLQSQFADCCCENRLGTADLKYTIATENCADRAALSNGVRDILAATQAQTQAILDKMCQDKIDEKNDEIAQLRQEVLYARGQASQVAQNSTIINGIYDRLNQCPVGTVPVYGEQPIFSCPNNNNGCGCGCGNF